MAMSTSAPPPLPPSIEEAYRRKCIQLRQRMNDIDDANAASTLRLQRMHRSIEKLRLERAFLLEQLAKRSSTHVEDSEGSPSPPPTPKEKPLRAKRGRKPSVPMPENGTAVASLFGANDSINQRLSRSPSQADTKPVMSSITQQSLPRIGGFTTVNGTPNRASNGPSSEIRDAFELFASENRAAVLRQHAEEIMSQTFDINREMAQQWQYLPEDQREFYRNAFAVGYGRS